MKIRLKAPIVFRYERSIPEVQILSKGQFTQYLGFEIIMSQVFVTTISGGQHTYNFFLLSVRVTTHFVCVIFKKSD